MYSKNFNLSAALFCIILYGAPLTISSSAALRENYYDKSCPKLVHIIREGVAKAYKKETRMAASLLRLQYQDCFVNGCEASLLLDDTKKIIREQSAPPNAVSIRGLDVIDAIKAELERSCPKTVSCADILALVAREAVSLAGGPSWNVLLGRLDALQAFKDDVMKQLPSPFDPLKTRIAKFHSKGLDSTEMVVLSGAHTIGLAQCFIFRGRLYNFTGTGKPDPSINPSLLINLQKLCKKDDPKSACYLAPLDNQTPEKFDNKYYTNILKKNGLLQSDQSMMNCNETADLVKYYGSQQTQFLNDFGKAMVKLGNIGVIVEKGKGEVRKECGCVNKLK